MTALRIKRDPQAVVAATSSFDEVARVDLFLSFLGKQRENALPLGLVRDDLVKQVTEVRDVLTSNKTLHCACEGGALPLLSSPTD